jgi:hypothetical protein
VIQLGDEAGPHRSLLICCSAFRGDISAFENLTVKKIPKRPQAMRMGSRRLFVGDPEPSCRPLKPHRRDGFWCFSQLSVSEKIDSDPERGFAVILENDDEVLKWFKPAKSDFRIHYRHEES